MLESEIRVAVALVNLPEHDERHRQMVQLSEPTIELNGRLSSSNPLLITLVGERTVRPGEVGVEPRLKAQVPNLLRELEPGHRACDRPCGVNRAVESPEVRIRPAGDIEKLV